jgi:tagatose-1,6-bisphosphate aldolase non-catalytic subunit AgaZ/GatZ
MSDPEVKKLIVDLFGNQLEAARKLQFADRTVRYWCQNGAPPHVERVLRNLKRKKISLRSARKQLRQQRERRPNRAATGAGDSRSSNPPADRSLAPPTD